MTEPVTINKTLIVPNTSDLPGTWGTAALNPNFTLIDAMLGGTTTIALSSATTILLSVPATSGVWGGSVPQSSNAMIKFTGAQTGTAVIQFSLPGFYIIDNRCTGTSVIVLSPASGAGSSIGVPPGQKTQVFFDGTDMDYVNLDKLGERVDLHGISSMPKWIDACSTKPYLVRDGSVHTASLYPQLAAVLGSTFGGNGVTTFGVPDSRSRVDLGIDIAAAVGGGLAGRITTAICGINGTTMGAAGGSESMAGHHHAIGTTITNGSNQLQLTGVATTASLGSGVNLYANTAQAPKTLTLATSVVETTGDGASQNVQPSIVSFLPLIKT